MVWILARKETRKRENKSGRCDVHRQSDERREHTQAKPTKPVRTEEHQSVGREQKENEIRSVRHAKLEPVVYEICAR
jgi:hypothetical protein